MKRVILDTNIYGKIIEEFHQNLIKEAVAKGIFKEYFIIYGFELIRKELRAVSAGVRIGDANLRIALLNLYDILVGKHSLTMIPKVKELALHYYQLYKELGGLKDEKILNDLMIVSCASINNLDIVYSNDNKTMVSQCAIKSYSIVNKILDIKTPQFDNYTNFIKEIRRLLT